MGTSRGEPHTFPWNRRCRADQERLAGDGGGRNAASGKGGEMHRKPLGATLLVTGLIVCAMAALAGSSWPATPSRYILRHPKREHCKRHYRKKVLTVKKRVHGHTRK